MKRTYLADILSGARYVLIGVVAIMTCMCLSAFTVYGLPERAVARLGKGSLGWRDRSVALSPDGSLLAVATSIGVYLYNPYTQEQIDFLETDEWMTCAAFSPDGKLLASGTDVRTVKLWDVNTREEERPLTANRSVVESIAFSPDGSLLAGGSNDGLIRMWSTEDWQEVVIPTGYLHDHQGGIRSLAFSPDGSLLASGSSDTTVKLWDVKNAEEPPRTLPGHSDEISSVAFSPDGSLLASGSKDSTVKLWDVKNPEKPPATLIGHSYGISSVAFNPHDNLLASGSYDSTIVLWDTESYQKVVTLNGHLAYVRSVAFSPDGSFLVSGSHDGTLRIWDMDSHKEIGIILGHLSNMKSIAFSPDGMHLAGANSYHKVSLWDLGSLQEVEPPFEHSQDVYSIAFNSDGSLLASGSKDNTVKLWQIIPMLQFEGTVIRDSSDVFSIAFSPDDRLLAIGNGDGIVRLWDMNSNMELKPPLVGHSGAVNSLAFSPDRGLLTSGGSDSTLRLWNVSAHQEVTTPIKHRGSVSSVAFSPDGQLIASGSDDETARLWDIQGQQVGVTLNHPERVNCVAFSPDSRFLATGCDDGIVRLWEWNVDSYQVMDTFTGHTSYVLSLDFSCDDQLLASGSTDGTILLWNMPDLPIRVPDEYPTVQAGIDAAGNGNKVLVADGTYTGKGNVNLNFKGRAITVRSENGPENCIIDCENVDGTRGFYFHSSESSDAVVEGFTIRNARNGYGAAIHCDSSSPTIKNNIITSNFAEEQGGGIRCINNSSPTITGNTIAENSAGSAGAGIWCADSSPTIVKNIITDNSVNEGGANDGGGIYCRNSSPDIVENTIARNTVPGEGGGIYCRDASSPMIKNNIITDNSAGIGSGIFCDSSSPTITGNSITSNSAKAQHGGGIYCGSNSSPVITNNVITGNSTKQYGGGIACHKSSSSKIMSNIISNNLAEYGGAISCNNESSPIVSNNTIVKNLSNKGGGAIYCSYASAPVLVNTILWYNNPQEIYSDATSDPVVSISYSDIQGGKAGIEVNDHGTVNWGEGNIDTDPLFVDTGNGDYRLSDFSPCIGAGTVDSDMPETDIAGNSRPDPVDSNPDLGAYENIRRKPGYIMVISPNGREKRKGGASYDITWEVSGTVGLHHIKLLYSIDDGSTYPNEIILSTENDGIHEWKLPSIDSTTLKVKAVVEDGGNNELAEDVSDENFVIDSTPPQTDIVPEGTQGENEWWISDVTVNLSATDNLTGVSQINYKINDEGWQIYTEPFSLTDSGYYRVSCKSQDGVENEETPTPEDISIDKTQPSVPIVTDNGDYTHSLTQLHASWTSIDEESGIAEYEYSIRTVIDHREVVVIDWTSAGNETEVTATGLSLLEGNTYYFDIKAKNSAGLWSNVGGSDGITVYAGPTNIHIAVIGDDMAGHGSEGSPYRTIQKGIDEAIDGDTVLVADGLYINTGNINLDFRGKAITVRSNNGPESCIIDCQNVEDVRGFYFHSDEGANSVLDGFTIQNSYSGVGSDSPYCAILCSSSSPTIMNSVIRKNSGWFGGGVCIINSASPLITNNIVEENTAEESGGGIYCSASAPTITGNSILRNRSGVGGGISCVAASSAIITNNTVEENSAEIGGGINCVSSSPLIANNIITGNSASLYGGALQCFDNSNPTIANNTVIGNSANLGGGAIYCENGSHATIVNTILWHNSPQEVYLAEGISPSTIGVSYSDVESGSSGIVVHDSSTINWGDGNIDADPLFVGLANGDYHLADTSPCIGAGIMDMEFNIPNVDIERNPRPNPSDSSPDIGAYESERSEPPDGQVPEADFSISPVPGSPLSRNFTDLSLNEPTSWFWDFGDGRTSNLRNPAHTYGDSGEYTVELAVANSAGSDAKSKTIRVFPIITATAGDNGTISPSGEVEMEYGGDQTFTIAPDECYKAWLEVDGITQGNRTEYTFSNVMENHTIQASFSIESYWITATAQSGGRISPSGPSEVGCGSNQTFVIAPDECYKVSDVKVDTASKGSITSYTFTNVESDHRIEAIFERASYTITSSWEDGGHILPAEVVTVNCGESQEFTVIPDDCYRIKDLRVDGQLLAPMTLYSFTNVKTDHKIEATFVHETFTIKSTTSNGGSITPSGEVAVTCGTDKTFTITPDDHYSIEDVNVDGVSRGAAATYRFTNVREDHTIHATFKNHPPTVIVKPIKGVQHSDVVIVYHLEDKEGDALSIDCEYTENGGKSWIRAEVPGQVNDITNYDGSITWKSREYFPSTGDKDTYVEFRMTPKDSLQKGESDTTGEFKLVNILGDYNNDSKVNGEDLAVFKEAWDEQDISKEVGPAEGIPPNLTPHFDGVIDYYDLVAFTRMWIWSVGEPGPSAHWFVGGRKPTLALDITDDNILSLSIPIMNGLIGYVSLEYNDSIIKMSPIDITSDNNVVFLSGPNRPGQTTFVFADLGLCDKDTPGIFKMVLNWSAALEHADVVCRYEIRNTHFMKMLSGVENRRIYRLPKVNTLLQNYPNPFNPDTWIPFHLAEASEVVIRIYNSKGQIVRMLNLGYKEAGFCTSKGRAAYWNGKNESGQKVSDGTYFYSISASDFTAIRKMVLME